MDDLEAKEKAELLVLTVAEPVLKVGDEFSCWEDFFESVKKYSESTNQPFVKIGNKSVAQANKFKQDKLYPEHLKIVQQTYGCTHRGGNELTSSAQRKRKSFKIKCSAKIHASVDNTSHRIVVRTLNNEHNHIISQEHFVQYPQNRRLTEEEQQDVQELAKLKVSTRQLKEHTSRAYGKNLTLHDIRNIKAKARKKDKTNDNGCQLNDTDLLLLYLEEVRTEDPGSTIEIAMDDDMTMSFVFFQDSLMKEASDKFSTHILVDCTYYINDRQMPLVTLMGFNGSNESVILALCLLRLKNKETLLKVFELLLRVNPSASGVYTFMVDKDFTEITSIKEAFPDAPVELPKFHVMKAMEQKINSLQCSTENKDLLRNACFKCIHATNENIYEQGMNSLAEINPEFFRYFVDNWHGVRTMWVDFHRWEKQNLGNTHTTSNHLESFHQKLKSEIPTKASLDVMFRNILLVVNILRNEHAGRLFNRHVKVSEIEMEYGELKKKLTPHAFEYTVNMLEKSKSMTCEENEDGVRVTDTKQRTFNVKGDVCNCLAEKQLPCAHVYAARRKREMAVVTLDLFQDVWLLPDPQAVPLFEGSSNVSTSVPKPRILNKREKYRMVKDVTDSINGKMSELSTHKFQLVLQRLKELDSILSSGSCDREQERAEEAGQLGAVERIEGEGQLGTMERIEEGQLGAVERIEGESIVKIDKRRVRTANVLDVGSLLSNIKRPLSVPKRGRPRGSGLTVFGGPRKRTSALKKPTSQHKKKCTEIVIEEDVV
ncbi:uncharacterized protein LOC101858205 isoform X1 [Aplysia californica]|uniref:Uncharacterized protein LOC101858205 isoform X1 n=1 Tax=Aplysia californica TaxID=6500 RepID=A0ABM0JY50_APLCA|nr:uncharacterized protein LOC101858205 isoform X1 [Aplysia californica]